MIKYKYLPFTRNKPRYQRVGEPTDSSKWQLAAQTLPTTNDSRSEEIKKVTTTETSTIIAGTAPTLTSSPLITTGATASTNVAKPPQIIMIDEWNKNKFYTKLKSSFPHTKSFSIDHRRITTWSNKTIVNNDRVAI